MSNPDRLIEHVDTAEVAKLIRRRLKAAFPAVRFSVRLERFAGGSAIDIDWMTGPTEADVSQITNDYRSARFDGSIDYGWSVSHWLLPDGSAIVARDAGSVGCRGHYEPSDTPQPCPDARLVSFGHLFLNLRRDLQAAAGAN